MKPRSKEEMDELVREWERDLLKNKEDILRSSIPLEEFKRRLNQQIQDFKSKDGKSEGSMIYITGDTHRDFDRIEQFCAEYFTTAEDILIILGDAGINYFLDSRDDELKKQLSRLPITLFCIHGNHEQRPYEIVTYDDTEWHGAIAYIEPEYPNLVFAKDGEIYDFNGKKAIAIGGAYSVDKFYRLRNGLKWFDNEQPSGEIKEYVEKQLTKAHWRVDYVFSHTVPESCQPEWSFLPNVDQSTIDKSTEEWLEEIYQKLDFDYWYAGHYHVESDEGRVRIMFEEVEELG